MTLRCRVTAHSEKAPYLDGKGAPSWTPVPLSQLRVSAQNKVNTSFSPPGLKTVGTGPAEQ